jgi:lauroyl/myristoyl acyltransferase
VDLVTPAYRLAAGLARAVPHPIAASGARGLGLLAGHLATERRAQVERNLRRVDPTLSGARLRRLVDHTFESYARYYEESFRLPGTSAAALDAGFRADGWHRVDEALEAGRGAIVALPHLGGWEWSGFWVTQVQGRPVTAVVEQLEPAALFDWFVELRRSFGFDVVPLGPGAGAATARALKANHTLALLCDRDLAGTGPEVEFFGERTRLPGGPATLALRSGAPLLPTAVYFDGPELRRSVVLPALDTSRQGRLRDDVARVTQDLAYALEDLIRRAPDQWHLLQPNWPSDLVAGP